MLGRERELAFLLTRLGEAREGSLRATLLGGAPGMGKSVLLARFTESARQADAVVIDAVCSGPAGDGATLTQILRGAQDAAGATGNRASRATGVVASEVDRDVGISSERLQELLLTLKDLAEGRPVVLVFHRAEAVSDGLRASLEETVRALAHSPVLLLLSTVWPLPTGSKLEPFLKELRSQGLLSENVLGPLERSAADRLVRELAGEIPAPPPFLEAVYGLSRGNPRLIIDLVTSALAHAGPRGMRLDDVDLNALPPTPALLERFRATLEDLSDDDRRYLEFAAASGTRFSARVIAASADAPAGSADRALTHLAEAGILVRIDAERIAFALPQLASMLYESLTDERRRSLHARLAKSLEAMITEQDNRYLSELGRHHALSDDFRSAYGDYSRAAERAHEVGDHEGSLKSYNLALKVLRAGEARPDPETEMALLDRMTELEVSLGLNEEAQRHFRETVELARRLQRKHDEAEALLGLAYALRRTGKHLKAIEEFTAAHRVAGEANAAGIMAEALRGIASCHYKTADFPAALADLQRSLEVRLEPEEHVLRGRTFALAGSVYGILGRFREAESAYLRALAHLEGRDPTESAHVRRLMSEVLLYEGQFARSLEVAERSQRDAEASGSEQVATVARVLQCEALIAMGRTAEGEARLKSVVGAKLPQSLAAQSLLALVRGGLSTSLGRYDEALAHLGGALERARAAGNIVYQAEAHYRTAIVYHYVGLEVRKRDTLQAALSIFKRVGNEHRAEQCRLWMRAPPAQSGSDE